MKLYIVKKKSKKSSHVQVWSVYTIQTKNRKPFNTVSPKNLGQTFQN